MRCLREHYKAFRNDNVKSDWFWDMLENLTAPYKLSEALQNFIGKTKFTLTLLSSITIVESFLSEYRLSHPHIARDIAHTTYTDDFFNL
jgi:hypothetical protein